MSLPNLQSYHLMVFYFVAKEKSMTLAADKLCLSQSTVTSHIKSLEKSTNLKLIRISKQKINLTQAGKGLFKYAKEVYQDVADAERFIELMKESNLNIGIGFVYGDFIAPAIQAIHELYPSTKLTIMSGEAFALVKDVLDSKIDLAIVPKFDYGGNKLRYIKISDKVRLVFYASPHNSIFRKEGKIEWQDLCNRPLISGTNASAGRHIILGKLKFEGSSLIPNIGPSVICNIELCKRIAESGDYIGLSTKRSIKQELVAGKLKMIPAPNDIWIQVDAVLRRDAFIPEIIRKFISLSKEAFQFAADD